MSRRIAGYYDDLAARFGNTPQAVDAPDQQALTVRHRVLADLTDMNDRTVLEVGCGHGALGAYLTSRYPHIRYTGIDISAGLLELGRKHHPELDLHQANLFSLPNYRYDIVLAQGIFYLLNDRRHAFNVIRRMYELTREACAFTALSTWGRDQRSGELHLDPLEALAFCRTLTPYVALRHDYRDGDLCVYLRRKEM